MTVLNKSYFIQYLIPSNNQTQASWIEDNGQIIIELFFKGYRTVQDALDEAMDIGDRVYRSASNSSRYIGSIKKVNPVSLIPEHIVSNDNAIIITVTLDVTLIRCLI